MRYYSDRMVALHRGAIAILLMVFLGVPPGAATAADTGAVANGDWSSAATWTNGVPGSSDNAYVGSTYPTGSSTTANVFLSQNTSAGSVYLGNGAGTSGTLDLGGQNLNAYALILGQNGGAYSVARSGGGNILSTDESVENGFFSFAPADATTILHVQNASAVSTIATGNVTHSAVIDAGGSLTLGSDLNLLAFGGPGASGVLTVGGTLNANGHALSVSTGVINLGETAGPFALLNRGPITAANLNVSSQFTPSLTIFNLTPADSVGGLTIDGVNTVLPVGVGLYALTLGSNGGSPPRFATAQLSTSSNVTGSVTVTAGCSLSLAGDLGRPCRFWHDVKGRRGTGGPDAHAERIRSPGAKARFAVFLARAARKAHRYKAFRSPPPKV